ncbi:hypothetical protein SAMN04489727_4301 [Amycolatopsis tolypomycina]|uniref:BNR repeat-like domain-containing protein n=1 Tax=Amycolatopsis tolypomycina TaxID=208445 RepID=A0A1H4TQC5_9PSEU|nr:hypothetical protein [Amycolatopsis tolypomycina]SEC58655.1 hypothetical protein SAMN04489727_4301 [Amycolatopsis tolypomycina]
MRRLGGILALSLAALAACYPGHLPPGDPVGALGFAVRPGAVQHPAPQASSSAYGGRLTLVPAGGCVLGFLRYPDGNGGHVPPTWLGTDGCTRLVLDQVPNQVPEQAAFAVVAAVPGPDGSLIGLGPWFSRRDRSGAVVRLFQPGSGWWARALVRAGRNLVGVGVRDNPGGKAQPVAWVSGDEGRTAHEIELPRDRPAYWEPRAIAAEGDRVLVAGSAGSGARVWASEDAGETWTVSEVPVRASDVVVTTVLRTGGKWLLAGLSAAGPLIVTGEPGNWQLQDHATLGDGRISGGTLDKAGKPVLVGEYAERDRLGSSRTCSVVWTLDATGWQRGELGCPEDPVSAALRLPDGRVLLASRRDLWIRP